MRMVLLLEISIPFKVQAEWPRMDVIVLTLVLSLPSTSVGSTKVIN